MAQRRSKKTGRFIRSDPWGKGASYTFKEKKAYRAGFQAGYEKAMEDVFYGR